MDRPDASGVKADPLQDSVFAGAREGHFVLESGLHTDRWFAVEAMFGDPVALAPCIARLSDLVGVHDPNMICGPMTGGALLAQAVATRLGSRFAWTERSTSEATSPLFGARYDLPVALRASVAGQRIAVVDDMISAGSATRATVASLTRSGAVVVVIGTLCLMGDEAGAHFATAGMPMVTVERRPLHLWTPEGCPLCLAGDPVSIRSD